MKILPLLIDKVFRFVLKQRKCCGIEMQRTHLSCGKVTENEANEAGRGSDILWKWTKIYATSVSFAFSVCARARQ